MSIKIQCPQCNEKYNAGNEYIGRRFRCKCNAIIAVPDLDEILNAPDSNGKLPESLELAGTDAISLPRSANTLPNFYGFLALICGTTGTLAAVNAIVFSVFACISPILQSPQENAFVAAGSLAVSLLAFLSAAIFRIADLVIRRNGRLCFF